MKAFVASGGASKGQYLIGALDYLLREKAVTYSIYSGVSIGALVCGFAAQYKDGEEDQLLADITNLSLSIHTKHVHKRWFLGYLQGLWKTGARNSSPLRGFIRDSIDPAKLKASGKALRVGTTKLSGKPSDPFVIFTEKSPYIQQAIMASTALSPILEAVEIEGEWFVDGGFQSPTPIKAAIEAGATEIDVVLCYPSKMSNFEYGRKLTTVDILKREIDLAIHKLAWLEIYQVKATNKLVLAGLASDKKYIKLNIICPKEELNVDSMKFDPEDAKRLQAQGFHDAKEYFSF